MDVVSRSLRRVHTMAKKALSFVPASRTKCNGQPACKGAGDIQKVALLTVTSDVRRFIHPNEATVTMLKM